MAFVTELKIVNIFLHEQQLTFHFSKEENQFYVKMHQIFPQTKYSL